MAQRVMWSHLKNSVSLIKTQATGLGQLQPSVLRLQRYPECMKSVEKIIYEPGLIWMAPETARRLAKRNDAGAHLARSLHGCRR